MKLTFKLILAAVALTGGALANEPAARLSTPNSGAYNPYGGGSSKKAANGHCATMLVSNNTLPKGMGQPTYVDCNSPAVRNSPACKRRCAQ